MTARLTMRSAVCAVVPHYECEAWLAQALESLFDQTRPPDAVVVVDDASTEPPVDVVRAFPDVTLLAAPDNGGPYRLVQAVVEATDFDAYLFQDADDWSAPDRLEVLLSTAEDTGAELVGSHEVRVLVDQGDLVPVRYPLDVNAVLAAKPTAFPLLHPTSMVGRHLVQRLGGFATGMRFSGDAEFLRRAGHVARVVNADHFGYFRRKRTGSLTMSADTGLQSTSRREVQAALAERARANAEAVAGGDAPDLRPWRLAPPVALRHLAGPDLASERRAVRRNRPHKARFSSQNSGGGPVFVVGAPRSGHALIAWALDQHPRFRTLADSRWLGRIATAVTAVAGEEAAPPPFGFESAMAAALAGCAVGANGRRWVASGTEVTEAAPALARLFPEARFVFVARDVEHVVTSLVDQPTEDGTFYTRELAYRQWVAATRIGLELEAGLGCERVLRLDYADVVGDPDTVLKGCLAFLDEDHEAGCARPFAGLVPDVPLPRADDAVSLALAEKVTDLVFRLAASPPERVDPAASARLQVLATRGRADGRRGLSLVEQVRDVVTRAVPEGVIVLVAGKGDPRLLELDGRVGWHFPQMEDGVYAGYHPADSAAAVAHLEELRARGAEFLVFPASGFWWLDFYDGLRRHLDSRYRMVAYQEDACRVYSLVGREVAR